MEIKQQIFFLCNDFERALGLERLLPNYHIICIDYNSGIETARKAGVKIFCLEEALQQVNPIFRNSNRLLNHPKVLEYIKKESNGETPNVIFFKIAPNIEASCMKLGFNILNTSSDLNHKFELKLSQYKELSTLGYFPKTIVGILEDIYYEDLIEELGLPFVIQYDRGHTGSSTTFIEDQVQFESEKKLFPHRQAKFSKKIDGEAWTLNACATKYGVFYGGLCYQITGVAGCTTKKGGTVGNDWTQTSRLSKEITSQISEMTQKVGEKMIKSGYQGLFGLDIIVDTRGKAYLIEVNARQPASTGMHTKLMLENNLVPLQLLHISEFLQSSINVLKSQNQQAINAIQASQLIIRNTFLAEITISNELKTGVYSYVNDDLAFIKDGYSIEDVSNTDEFLILAGGKGRIVTPESELARIQARYSLPSDEKTLQIIEKIKSKMLKK